MTVLACEATLFYGAAQTTLNDVAREWGDPAFSYNIENTINAYYQEPACGYPIKYSIMYENVIENPNVRFAEQPVEAEYNPDTFFFKIEKCSDDQKPFDLSYDGECAENPFEKHYKVWIHAYLEGEPGDEASDQVHFDVEIGNICE